jgi:anti-sigma B factor antagonist
VELKLGHYGKDGIEVVDVEGEIDICTAPRLRGLLVDLASKNSYQLVINLDKAGFLDSTGLEVLAGGLNRVRAHDGSLDLVRTSRTSVPRCCARRVPPRASATGSARRGQRNWIKSFRGHGREGAPAAAGSARQAGRKQDLAGLSSLPAALGTTAAALLAGSMLVGSAHRQPVAPLRPAPACSGRSRHRGDVHRRPPHQRPRRLR